MPAVSKFENLVNYDICQAVNVAVVVHIPFENLVNYDICQANFEDGDLFLTFENLVNYDICQAMGKRKRRAPQV